VARGTLTAMQPQAVSRTAHTHGYHPAGSFHQVRPAMQQLRIVALVVSGGRSLTRPFRDGRRFPSARWYPYRGLRVRREGLGVVHRSRSTFCRPVPNLSVAIRNCFIAAVRGSYRSPVSVAGAELLTHVSLSLASSLVSHPLPRFVSQPPAELVRRLHDTFDGVPPATPPRGNEGGGASPTSRPIDIIPPSRRVEQPEGAAHELGRAASPDPRSRESSPVAARGGSEAAWQEAAAASSPWAPQTPHVPPPELAARWVSFEPSLWSAANHPALATIRPRAAECELGFGGNKQRAKAMGRNCLHYRGSLSTLFRHLLTPLLP
jgi:hypothetical protein